MEFVLDGVGRTAGFAERLGQEPALGGEEFVSRFQLGLERAASPIREVTARNRLAGRPGLESLFDGSAGRSERDRLMHRAHERHGYTVSEIARCLGVHRTTASRAIRRAEMRQFTV
jgi:DNA-directed RNA polymerase specialized sigma24 family protein